MEQDGHQTNDQKHGRHVTPLALRDDEIVARYGAEAGLEGLDDAQRQELLVTLYRIMQGFVELGFSIKAGDKFTQNAALGMDDVIHYLFSDHAATEDPSCKIDK